MHGVELAVDPHREEHVGGTALLVECVGEGAEVFDPVDRNAWRFAESGDHRERGALVVGDLADQPVGADPEHVTVEHDHLAVEILERAETEVTVLAHHADRHRTLVHALDQRAGGRHLVERVVLDPEVLGQGTLDEVVDRCAAAERLLLQRGEHRRVDAGTQLGHPGNVAVPPSPLEKSRRRGNRAATPTV